MNIGFWGAGNLPSAIIDGFLQAGSPVKIFVNDVNQEIVNEYKAKGMDAFKLDKGHEISDLSLLLIALKPHILPKAIKDLQDSLAKSKHKPLIISVVAGYSLSSLSELLGTGVPIIRLMPNLNARVNAGIFTYCCNEHCTAEQVQQLEELFKPLGLVMPLDESLFSVAFALGGSSPAFAYLFIDALANGAVKMGMNKKTALALAAQAVLGSAKTILEAKQHPQVLVEQVCSPKGMTIEGVHLLKECGFEGEVMSALEKAILKEAELGKGSSK